MVGVHTPEFEFEKDLGNVRCALKEMKVVYPIAVDNDYAIWRAFDNQYWPALYFADARDLNLVMGPSARGLSVRFRVTLDGRPAADSRGDDVDEQGNGTLNEQRLYQLIRQPKPVADRRFKIEFLDPGAEAFAFTFG